MSYERPEADQKAIDEWLAKGNKITVCPKYERTANTEMKYVWGRTRKKKTDKKEEKK